MRLTAKERDQALFLRPNGDKYEAWSALYIKQSEVRAVLEKLAAFEDTGYSPLEIKSLEGEWNAMRKIVDSYRKAEDQGLLVRLPCKVGDKVYLLWSCGKHGKSISEMVVKHIDIDLMPDIEFACRKEKGTGSYWFFKPKDIGKTVFMSREEAEAALKGGQDDGTS